MTARLVTPNGATVTVADEKADRLLAQGYRRADAKKAAPKKVPAKAPEK